MLVVVRVMVFHNFYRSTRPSGENNAVLADVRALREAGHDVFLAERTSDLAFSGGVLPLLRSAGSAVYSFTGRRTAVEEARRFRPDVAHLHNLAPLWSPSVLDGLAQLAVPRIQVLHSYRLSCLNGSHMLQGAPCYRCLGKAAPVPGVVHRCYNGSLAGSAVMAVSKAVNDERAKSADWYLAVSSTVRDRAIQHGVPAGVISLKPEYLESDQHSPGALSEYLLFLGRLDLNKGCLLLLDAYARYRGDGGRLTLRIAGSGPLESEIAARASRITGVEMLGHLDPAAARSAVAGARAVVSPALWAEPFGLTVLEAWREGKPPVVTGIGGPAEMVTEETGWVVQPTPGDLCAALLQAEDEDEARRRGANGLGVLREQYSSRAVIAAYESAWSKVAAGEPV